MSLYYYYYLLKARLSFSYGRWSRVSISHSQKTISVIERYAEHAERKIRYKWRPTTEVAQNSRSTHSVSAKCEKKMVWNNGRKTTFLDFLLSHSRSALLRLNSGKISTPNRLISSFVHHAFNECIPQWEYFRFVRPWLRMAGMHFYLSLPFLHLLPLRKSVYTC